MKKDTIDDSYYMGIAIRLARRGAGKTSPNPIVGAVIVANGKIIGQGYHKRCGDHHAEINAIKSAKKISMVQLFTSLWSRVVTMGRLRLVLMR